MSVLAAVMHLGNVDFVPDEAGEYAVVGANKIPEVSEHTSVALAGNRLPANVSVVPGGEAVRLLALTAIVTSLEANVTGAALGEKALALLRGVDTEGAGDGAALRASHEAAWAARHGAGRVEVEGDLELALAINASLYFIRARRRRRAPRRAPSAGLL